MIQIGSGSQAKPTRACGRCFVNEASEQLNDDTRIFSDVLSSKAITQKSINLFIRPSLVRRCLSWRRTRRARSSSRIGQHPLILQSVPRRRGTRNTLGRIWRVVCQTSSVASVSSTWKVEPCKPRIPSASDQADGATNLSKTMLLLAT